MHVCDFPGNQNIGPALRPYHLSTVSWQGPKQSPNEIVQKQFASSDHLQRVQ